MAIVIAFNYILPQNGDKGSVWFPALETNITKLSTHNHDGVNSAKLSGGSVDVGTVTVLPADWVLVSTGVWSKTKNCPPNFTMDASSIAIKNASGFYCYPTLERASLTTFTVYTNDPTQTFTVIFK